MEETVLEFRQSAKMMAQKSFSRMVWTPTLVRSLKFVQVLKQFMATFCENIKRMPELSENKLKKVQQSDLVDKKSVVLNETLDMLLSEGCDNLFQAHIHSQLQKRTAQ